MDYEGFFKDRLEALCAEGRRQPRPADRRVQMLDAEPGIVPPGFVRAADLQQHDVDRQQAAGYEAANIGNIGRHDVVGGRRKTAARRWRRPMR